ncbi:hypothetical protein KGD82_16730 [Nocardiopsis eucommiae]|uniref:Uncharacterized protein n=1 Tax=Nocardiopsis eucommiae TaxID=2831970 RepID=A0A975L7A7_9ACTN|nr:hypothetical protein KGD82_16730 [Nocardiopsis eucommiae]
MSIPTPEFDVKVVGPDDYAAMILLGKDGHASIRTGAGTDAQEVGDLLTCTTGQFHQRNNLALLVTDEIRTGLSAAGWAPPFDATDHHLSDHDWMELVAFDGKCRNEGFGYAADEYPPRFEDEALSAAISHAPMDRLKKLVAHHEDAIDAWWEQPDAIDLINAHQAAQRADRT